MKPSNSRSNNKLIKSKSGIMCVGVFFIMLLTSCSSVKDASKENFSVAIRKYIINTPSCNYSWVSLPYVVGFKNEPNMKANQPDYIPFRADLVKLDYFVKIGFLQTKERDNTKSQNSAFAPSTMEFRGYPYEREYTLAEKGGKFAKVRDNSKDAIRMINNRSTNYNLCYARTRELDKIIKFDEPAEKNGMKMTNVTYSYKITGLDDWFKQSDIDVADAEAKNRKSMAGKDGGADGTAQATLKLTNEGWEVVSIVQDWANN
jgi:hypothetical protein